MGDGRSSQSAVLTVSLIVAVLAGCSDNSSFAVSIEDEPETTEVEIAPANVDHRTSEQLDAEARVLEELKEDELVRFIENIEIVLATPGPGRWVSQGQSVRIDDIGDWVLEHRVVGGVAVVEDIRSEFEDTGNGVVMIVNYDVVTADENSTLTLIRGAAMEKTEQ